MDNTSFMQHPHGVQNRKDDLSGGFLTNSRLRGRLDDSINRVPHQLHDYVQSGIGLENVVCLYNTGVFDCHQNLSLTLCLFQFCPGTLLLLDCLDCYMVHRQQLVPFADGAEGPLPDCRRLEHCVVIFESSGRSVPYRTKPSAPCLPVGGVQNHSKLGHSDGQARLARLDRSVEHTVPLNVARRPTLLRGSHQFLFRIGLGEDYALQAEVSAATRNATADEVT
mmetsp:Transcript_22916/g.55993  ORF Transcript_22916/g.55993 Transcript_22916/m.55993 type:complete len:223 (-) Transcript_22916:267-935(-)